MPEINISILGVVVAAIVNMVIGYLWYGPLFGKKWLEIVKLDPKKLEEGKKKMPQNLVVGLVAALVTASVLSYFIGLLPEVTAVGGAIVGALAWVGFVGTQSLGMVLWEGRPVKLYLLNNEYTLVSFAVMGAILAVL